MPSGRSPNRCDNRPALVADVGGSAAGGATSCNSPSNTPRSSVTEFGVALALCALLSVISGAGASSAEDGKATPGTSLPGAVSGPASSRTVPLNGGGRSSALQISAGERRRKVNVWAQPLSLSTVARQIALPSVVG